MDENGAQQQGDNQTTVRWVYTGNTSPYYVLRVSHLLLRLKKQVANYMKTSLANLKNRIEAE